MNEFLFTKKEGIIPLELHLDILRDELLSGVLKEGFSLVDAFKIFNYQIPELTKQ